MGHGQPKVLFVGAATVDSIALVPAFPHPDQRVVADELVFAGGGPAATAAVAAARLGVAAAFVGTVGDDADGRRIVEGLEEEGVDTSGVTVARGHRSGASVIVVDHGRGTRAICARPGPPVDAAAVAAAVGSRTVRAILLTHGHDDHIAAVGEFRGLVNAPVYLHRDDWILWERVFPGTEPDHGIDDGDTFEIAGGRLVALSTPGHSPGSVSFHLPAEGTVFTGDTLFHGGPGATGRSFSDFPTIIASIKDRLFTLPPDTVVRTGHGESTTIGAEAPQLQEWIARGH